MTMNDACRLLIVLLLTSGLAVSCATSPPAQVLADEYYNLGNAWFDLKKFDLAGAAYQKALTWNPKLKIASLNLARTKAESGDTAAALALLEPLEASDPDNIVVAQYRAWLTAKSMGPAAAAPLYSSLESRLLGDAPTRFNAGLCFLAAGKLNDAKTSLAAWKTLDGKGSVGLLAYAEVLGRLKDDLEAQAWQEAASSLPEGDAKRFRPLAARGQALAKQRQFADAVNAWQAALALPEAADQERARTQFQLGSVLIVEIEDYSTGIEALRSALKLGYKEQSAWKSLLETPGLKMAVKLEADLRLAGWLP